MPNKPFKKGIHPFDNKDLTADISISVMPEQEDYFVALSQHIGAPSTAVVEVNDVVAEGQLVAKATGYVSANIFSPVSGKVVEILQKSNATGGMGTYIHIHKEGDKVVTLPPIEQTKENILSRIEEAGIVGLGGAGFPCIVKDKPVKPVDVLLINAAECEPYLNCDNRLIIEHSQEIISGIKLLAKAIGVERVIVGIEDNKKEAYEKLLDSGFEIELLKTRYPQGAEKVLIYACLGRKVPNAGGLPMDVGVVVHNVATAYAVFDAVVNGRPLYQRVLTVSGKGVDNPTNMWVKSGTPHKAIFDYCRLNDKAVKLISGGPMMGKALDSLVGFTTKTESGLLALTQSEIADYEPTPCISCSRCAYACPMNLMPMYIDFYTHANNTDLAIKYGAKDCIECGCCAYVCPARRPIVQSVRLTKARAKGGKK